MASIQQRSSGRWAVRWRDDQGQQRWQTFPTRDEAKRFASGQPDGSTAPATFAQYAGLWTARQLWRPGTRAQVDCYLNRYLLPEFGQQPLIEVRPADIQLFVRRLSDRLAPASVRLIVAHLRSLFNEAVRDGVVESNPARQIRVPRQTRTLVRPPTLEQVRLLRAALPDRHRALVDLAAGSGLRQGECLGLTVDRVEFDNLVIIVDRQLAQPPIQGTLFGPPKTSSSVRRVPIAESLALALRLHVEAFGLGPHRLLFSDDLGRPLKRRAVSSVWMPAARLAGLPERTGMHCLRHFYASLLIHSGCSVKVVQARLGHATAAETLDTYAHLWPEDDDRTRAALQALSL